MGDGTNSTQRGIPGVLGDLPRNSHAVLSVCVVLLVAIFLADLKTQRVLLDTLYFVPAAVAAIMLPTRYALCAWVVATALQVMALQLDGQTLATIAIGATSLALVFILIRLLVGRRFTAPDARSGRTQQARPPVISFEDQLGALTRRERQIARLVADGWSAQEIADRLSIGRRTVETHVSRTYAKLGVDSRVDLILRLNGRDLNSQRR